MLLNMQGYITVVVKQLKLLLHPVYICLNLLSLHFNIVCKTKSADKVAKWAGLSRKSSGDRSEDGLSQGNLPPLLIGGVPTNPVIVTAGTGRMEC